MAVTPFQFCNRRAKSSEAGGTVVFAWSIEPEILR